MHPGTGNNNQTDLIGINFSSGSIENTGSMSINSESNPNDDSTNQSADPNTNDFMKNLVARVHNLWKRDAVQRIWTVDVPKLSKTQLYELSHPPCNWDQIDLYSSLEEMADTEVECKPHPDETLTGNSNQYVL